jgi:hypothetical protein
VATNLATPFSQSSVIARPFVGLYTSLFAVSVQEGVKNQLWASVSPEAKSGVYYTPVGYAKTPEANARDEGLAKRLWEWTEKELEGQEA